MSKSKGNEVLQFRFRCSPHIGILIMLFLLYFSSIRWNVGTDTWHTYTPEYLAIKAQLSSVSEEEKTIMLTCFQKDMKMDYHLSDEEIEYLSYEDAYEWFSLTAQHTGPGFQVIEKVLACLNADVQWLYFVTSFFTLFFVFLSIYLQSNNPIFAILLFIITGNYFLSLNVVAQYMAISVCLFSYYFAQKENLLLFVICILLATCFHTSALVFLPVYFLKKIDISPIYCAIGVGLLLLLSGFFVPLLENFISLSFPKYLHYFVSDAEFEFVFFALGIAVLVFGGYYYKIGKDRPYYRLWYYSNILGLFALCFSGSIPWIKRINYYYSAAHFLLIPLIIDCEKELTKRRILRIVIVLLFCAETYISVGLMNKNEILPYQTIFDGSRVEMTERIVSSFATE